MKEDTFRFCCFFSGCCNRLSVDFLTADIHAWLSSQKLVVPKKNTYRTKKVALTFFLAKRAKSWSLYMPGPSSKVKATTPGLVQVSILAGSSGMTAVAAEAKKRAAIREVAIFIVD